MKICVFCIFLTADNESLPRTISKKIYIFAFYLIFVKEKQLTRAEKVLTLSVKWLPTWRSFRRQKLFLTSRSYETLVALGRQMTENLQVARRLF